jgi:hypothetical protein
MFNQLGIKTAACLAFTLQMCDRTQGTQTFKLFYRNPSLLPLWGQYRTFFVNLKMEIDPAPKKVFFKIYFCLYRAAQNSLDTFLCKFSLWCQVTSPPPFILAFKSLAVALGTARFTIQKLYILVAFPLWVVYRSENKQRLLLYTALTDWFCVAEVESVYCAVRL